MVSFVLVTRTLGSDRAHVLPGGDQYARAVTALLGTHFTDYGPPAPVPPVRVGRREVDTSVLNGFPDSQQFSVACTPCRAPGLRLLVVAREAGLSVDHDALVLKSSAPLAHYRQVLGRSGLALSEPVVPRQVWIPSMKLPEFLQTAYRKVVEWLFRPVFAFRIVEPFDEV